MTALKVWFWCLLTFLGIMAFPLASFLVQRWPS
jgi:hypothetical protein